ncbi:hypothetical protein OBBRIDRAFT_831165 [Obba rivulosa]|uniref:Uncharacterized protein n=1 Tax=Obba rivulosa TaxID=1052685 RepID=A0A8E2DTD4_9APHY|nr:hypothetical protein OBBRIDRAFT_831165 [Obba rivulosa]
MAGSEPPHPPYIDSITEYDDLLDHLRGPCEVKDAIVLAIYENKGLPDIDQFRSLSCEQFDVKLKTLFRAKFREAVHSILGQVGVYFAAHKDQEGIVVVATVGHHFCWANCERSSVRIPSDNEDGTFKEPEETKEDKLKLKSVYPSKWPDTEKRSLTSRSTLKRVQRVPQVLSQPIAQSSAPSQSVIKYTDPVSESEDDSTSTAGNAVEHIMNRLKDSATRIKGHSH